MASYRHYRSESVVSLIRGDTDSKSGMEMHGVDKDAVYHYEKFYPSTPVWEVTDNFLEAIEPGGSSLPVNVHGNVSPVVITSSWVPNLDLAITARDQIQSVADGFTPLYPFVAFEPAQVYRSILKEDLNIQEVVTVAGTDVVFRNEQKLHLKMYPNTVIAQVTIPRHASAAIETGDAFHDQTTSFVIKKKKGGIDGAERIIRRQLQILIKEDPARQFKVINGSTTPYFSFAAIETGDAYFEDFRSIVRPPVVSDAGAEQTVINISVGHNLTIDTVSRYESGQQIVSNAISTLEFKSQGQIEQNTTLPIDVLSTIDFLDFKDCTVVSSFTDITVGAKFNEVKAESYSFVSMPEAFREKSRVDYEYQINLAPKIKHVLPDIMNVVNDLDTFSTVLLMKALSDGSEETTGGGGSSTTFPYNRGTVDYQIERFVLTQYIIERGGTVFELDEDFTEVILRDGPYIVRNLPVYSPDGLENYQLGNAGVTLEGFENMMFIDTGINDFGNTFFDFERMYGDQIRIEDFDTSIRGFSAVLMDGTRFNMGIPSIQTPVTKSSGSLVGDTITVQSTVYFEDSGKLLFAHGDGTISVYDYTGKTETGFTGLSLHSGSGTAISANDEIIPFQII